MVLLSTIIIGFIVSLIVSTLIIFLATKLMGETEGLGTAIGAAFIGSLIFSAAYYFISSSFWAAAIGGLAWLLTLQSLYKIGWIKSAVIAIIIWLIAGVISYVLPTITGPL
jgi:hypothetical protein